MDINNIKNFLNELSIENAINLISVDFKNNIYHFLNNDNIHYSLAKVGKIWELMSWETLNIEKIYNSNFDVIYNLYNDI